MLLLYGKPHFTPDSLPRPNKVSAYLSDLVSYCACHSSLVFCSFLPKALYTSFSSDEKVLCPDHCMTGFFSSFGLSQQLLIPQRSLPDHPIYCVTPAATVTLFSFILFIVLYIIFHLFITCLCHWKNQSTKNQDLGSLVYCKA